MKKQIITVIVLLLVIVAVSSPVFSQTSKRPSPTTTPIKIGGSLPLTGIFSEPAKWIKEGYNFWAEDINERGGLLGRPVQMIIYDDESNTDKAVTYYERAITFDKVDLVFGGYPGTANVALMPLLEKYEMVFIGQGGHLKSFEQGYTYSFASPPLMSEWVPLSLSGMLDDLIPKGDWPKSVAILTMNNVIGLSARGNLIKMANDRGIKVVVDETYNLPLSDASPLISKARGRGAELLCCMSMFDDAIMIMRAAKAVNYNPKLIFHMLAAILPAWSKELGEDGNNVTNNSFWHPLLSFPGNSKINQGAKVRFGLPGAPLYFGFGYSWMYTLELAVQATGSLDQKRIRDYLRSHKFDLPYGRGITFDSKGLPPPFAFGAQTTNGKIEIVWPKEIATTRLVYPRPQWSK